MRSIEAYYENKSALAVCKSVFSCVSVACSHIHHLHHAL